ncbi:hypothetical protein PHISP_04763 [Aspergillus sp. HF37]|nr:hypothetical protein PHISP_04763 [Aspergillus sp. HF37]
MKLLIVTTTLLFALFSTFSFAAAIDAKSLLSRDETAGLEFVATALPDGGSKVEVFSGETLEGTVIEHGDDIKVFDGDGEELNLEELRNEDESNSIEKRGRWAIIVKLGKLIAKWGSRAWSYICSWTAP